MKTVAVVGASGFVGSTLVERLLTDGTYNVRPLIHSSGNAGRLARRPLDLVVTDLMSRHDLQTAIQGCEFVVNCSRGSADVMIRGLTNLLRVCRECRVERFVHLSSTAVFGERFSSTVVDEEQPVNAAPATYGRKKAEQDDLVHKAARRGLPAVVLCPPNITGPYSIYLQEVVQSLSNNDFVLVDEGRMHCSVVDVQNLAHAICCAFTASVADGRRIIVADEEPVNWHGLTRPLMQIAGVDEISSIGIEHSERLAAQPRPPRKSILRAIRHLLSSDVRSALTQDPLWELLQSTAIGMARRLPQGVQDRLKGNGRPDHGSTTTKTQAKWNTRLIAQQLRNVQFSSARAREIRESRTPV
jgi:nucleoside-diphosphate-sugar epimerase